MDRISEQGCIVTLLTNIALAMAKLRRMKIAFTHSKHMYGKRSSHSCFIELPQNYIFNTNILRYNIIEFRKCYRQNMEVLKGYTDPDVIAEILYKNDFISHEAFQNCESMSRGPEHKSRIILMEICRTCDQNMFNKIIQTLKENGQEEFASLITGKSSS